MLVGSLQRLVENPSFYPKLTIVYHLSASGALVDALKPLCYMPASTWQPLYIYIKEIRIHNNKRVKDGQSSVMENKSKVNKTLWLVYICYALPTNPVIIRLKGRTMYTPTCTQMVDYCQLFRRTSCKTNYGHPPLWTTCPQKPVHHATKQNHSKNSNAGYHLHKPEPSFANPTQRHATSPTLRTAHHAGNNANDTSH